jgi:Uma2 family endonuclease
MLLEQKTYTVEEYEAFLALPENHDRLFELIDGEIVEKMPTEEHGVVTANLIYLLMIFTRRNGSGRVTTETRYRAKEDTRNDRLPDIAFTRAERLQPLVTRDAAFTMPDLCIEVQSPDDTPKKMRDKAAYYLANGAQQVWLVYPKKQMVEVLYPNGEFDIYTIDATLPGGDLLPDFALPVRDIFADETDSPSLI